MISYPLFVKWTITKYVKRVKCQEPLLLLHTTIMWFDLTDWGYCQASSKYLVLTICTCFAAQGIKRRSTILEIVRLFQFIFIFFLRRNILTSIITISHFQYWFSIHLYIMNISLYGSHCSKVLSLLYYVNIVCNIIQGSLDHHLLCLYCVSMYL